MSHARKQGHADGFQVGWHGALSRIREGDTVGDLTALVPMASVDECRLSANDVYHIMLAWEKEPASLEQTRIVTALGRLREYFIQHGDSKFVQPLRAVSQETDRPAHPTHGDEMSVPHDREHGWPDETWTVDDLLRSLSSWANSVRFGSHELDRALTALNVPTDAATLGFGAPAFQSGVGDRIDRAVDVLREKMRQLESVATR